MRTLHLFAGAGGGLYADLILGHTPICAVEWDPYCCAVLRERAADGWFPGLYVHEGDVRLLDASAWAGRVDCVHAGFPCQPHSEAGKRRGARDKRNLWPAVVAVLRAVRPRFVFLENVPGLVSNGFIATVLRDLAGLGYDAQWTLLGAATVGAPHLRDRWWCLAHLADSRRSRAVADAARLGRDQGADEVLAGQSLARAGGEDMGDADGEGEQQPHGRLGEGRRRTGDAGWWDAEPCVGRVVDGLAPGRFRDGPGNRRTRAYRSACLEALGNGQVALCAAAAWRLLGGPLT